LKYIPFTGRTREFEVQAGTIERSNVMVPVIEVSAHMTEYLVEQDDFQHLIPEYRQLIHNSIKRIEDMNRYPGVKFGSLQDPQTEGNWE
jgi:hypothetical protein